mmetsp:Transcript_29904/g.84313  ORF Transcript_29904/g.84313 Transcript_29904/m.84313 type:complete len:760 (+) Transcript_29904:280-2559(+)|eukprot:CAMPEP_0117663314 /NCGR_PEP_ID=MMETSP0804-20121206/8535_1 /TAXON_ID=1074897 /ORGANISM="Tetraselmis astigmatica, Strain CCMP880" /LENGTH=759 /DNA_ID=CAMNT_0005470301 /DNA_START=220 /DNA_END=2499 /DNA_ORIENTATION=+
MSQYLKHQFYEDLYPDHAEPVTLTEIKDRYAEILRAIRACTPRGPLIRWTEKEVERWTTNLPVKGLKDVAKEVLAGLDGAVLSTLTDKDLTEAGMTSKVHRAQLLKARDLVLQRDSDNADDSREDDGFVEALGILTSSMEARATVQQAQAFEMLAAAAEAGGKQGEAVSLFRKALQIRESAQGEDHVEVGEALERLSEAVQAAGDSEEAEDLLWRALKVNEAAAGESSEAVASTLERLIVLLDKQGRPDEANQLAERLDSIRAQPAVALLRQYATVDNIRMVVLYSLTAVLFLQIVAPEFLEPMVELLPGPWVAKWQYHTGVSRLYMWENYHGKGHPSTTPYLMSMASAYEHMGQLEEAALTYERVEEICRDNMGPREPMAAEALSRLGQVYIQQGRLQDAEAKLSKAVGIYTSTGDFFPVTDLAATQSQLAEVLRRRGRFKDALPLFKQAAVIQAANYDYIDDCDVAATLAGLGHVLAVTGNREEAMNATERALKLTMGLRSGRISQEILDRVLDAAETMEAMGDFLKAATFFQRAADVAKKMNGVNDETVARCVASLASCLARLEGRGMEAEVYSLDSIRIAKEGYGASNPKVAYFLVRRGGLLAASKRVDEALEILTEASDLLETVGEEADTKAAWALHTNLGGVLLNKGEAVEAQKHMRKAIHFAEELHGGRHPTVGNACSNFAAVLASLGKKEEAMEQLQRAKEAWEDSFGDQAAAAKVAALQARVDHQLAKHEKSLQKEPEAADKPLAGPAAE